MNDLRILAIGAFSVPYIKDNWFDAIKHVYPDTSICFNATPFIAAFDQKVAHEYVFNLLQKEKIDYVFFYFDWVYNEFRDDFFNVLKQAHIPVAVFYPDDEPEGWYNRNLKYDHLYDLIATHSTLGMQRRIDNNQADKVFYSPWGYNQRIFINQECTEKKYDIVFIGKNKVHKNEPKLHREDGKSREDALLVIAEQAKINNWNFALFGFGWENHPELSEFAGGQIDNDSMVKIYNQSKIVFNPGWSNDDVPKPQTKLRHFEVPGAGSFQLTNYNQELSELFEEKNEICFYRNTQELLSNIQYYLEHENERRQIANAGYKRAISEHTLDHRVNALFSHMASKWPPKSINEHETQALKIRQITIENKSEIPVLINQLKSENLDSFDAVHFLAGNFSIENIEYNQLTRLIKDNKFELLAIRTFFDYQEIAENWLQPSSEEIYGDFLNEQFKWEDLSEYNRVKIKESFITLENGKNVFLLSNFIVTPVKAIALLEAFYQNSLSHLENLDAFNSGYLINHLIVDKPDYSPENKFEPHYIRYLKPVLKKSVRQNQRIIMYGAKGLIAERVLDYIFKELPENLVGIIDNGQIGNTIQGKEVYGHEKLLSLKPDIVLIAATVSGPEIYDSLKLEKTSFQLIPLYDLEHAVWKILLP
ncbi:MAG: glycosyltransferase [Gammaproteobacteria bacterium]|nr:glycosyltransferase [Gammaproteobacteria bacterium]